MDEAFEVTMAELEESACWRLIAASGFGRVGFVEEGGVAVLPINVAVVDHRLVFRTSAGTSLARVDHGSAVAFQADHVDRMSESGWSVLVRGTLHDVTDQPETAAWLDVLVRPWAPDPRPVWMMIEPRLITGRKIERHRKLRVRSGSRETRVPDAGG